jgi:hypothetical protein
MKLQVIFDGTVYAAGRNLSQTFKGGQFLYFDPQLETNQSLEMGVSLIARLPGLNGTIDKLWDNLGTMNSDNIIPIPREVSEANFDFYLGLGSSIDQPNFRAYVIYSEVTQESISSQIDDLKAEIDKILQNQTTAFNLETAIGLNQLAQNTALTILGTGLVPISAGVTAGVVPVLSGASLLPLLP